MTITDDPEYDLRYTTTADTEFLQGQLMDLENRQWHPPSSEKDVNVYVRNLIGFGRYKACLTAVYKDEVIGIVALLLMPYRKVMHLAMVAIQVDPKFQRKGVGESLIKNILHLGKTRFKLESVHFEVFEGCPICGLLEKMGFDKIVEQDDFVQFPNGFRKRFVYEKKL